MVHVSASCAAEARVQSDWTSEAFPVGGRLIDLRADQNLFTVYVAFCLFTDVSASA